MPTGFVCKHLSTLCTEAQSSRAGWDQKWLVSGEAQVRPTFPGAVTGWINQNLQPIAVLQGTHWPCLKLQGALLRSTQEITVQKSHSFLLVIGDLGVDSFQVVGKKLSSPFPRVPAPHRTCSGIQLKGSARGGGGGSKN